MKKLFLISLVSLTARCYLSAMHVQQNTSAELTALIERALAEGSPIDQSNDDHEEHHTSTLIARALAHRLSEDQKELAVNLGSLSSIKRKSKSAATLLSGQDSEDELNFCQDFGYANVQDPDLDCTQLQREQPKKSSKKKVNAENPYDAALTSGNVQGIALLLEAGEMPPVKEGQNSILHKATWNGQTQIVGLLVTLGGMSVTLKGKNGNLPIHYAAYRHHKDLVELFHSEGADLHALSDTKNSPLHCAAYAGALECVIYLLDNYALVLSLNDREWTPLHCAAYKGHGAILSLLIAEVLNTHKSLAAVPKLTTLVRCAMSGGQKELGEYLSKLLANAH